MVPDSLLPPVRLQSADTWRCDPSLIRQVASKPVERVAVTVPEHSCAAGQVLHPERRLLLPLPAASRRSARTSTGCAPLAEPDIETIWPVLAAALLQDLPGQAIAERRRIPRM